MIIRKAYKFRMYPSIDQQELINKTIGCSRFIYNKMLEMKLNNKNKSRFDLNKEIPLLYNEYPFLKEVDSLVLRCAVKDLSDGFDRYYKGQNEIPHFKKKGVRNSYRTNLITSSYKGNKYANIQVDLDKKIIKLPKLKEVRIRGYRNLSYLSGKIIDATVERVANRYYVSVVVEENITYEEKKEMTAVGVDLGVKNLVVTSDGDTYSNPKYLSKYEKKIKGLGKSLSRKQKNSKNYYKAKLKLGETHRKLGNARKKYLEEIISKITKDNDVIITEKLKIKEMLAKKKNNKSLRKEINNATFNQFIKILEYKCKWLNKTFYQIDTYYPSSQICSNCGNKDVTMKDLRKREYKCKKCGNEIERDYNASINILIEGLKSITKERLLLN